MKPPLMSDEEITQIIKDCAEEKDWRMTDRLLEAQRDSDIKWFNQWLEEKGAVTIVPVTAETIGTLKLVAYVPLRLPEAK